MANLPSEIKLSPHARERLRERNNLNRNYNTHNIMKSSVKWYNKDDGNIEVIYSKNTHVAITVLEVKDQFRPITQYIKPILLKAKE